MAKRVYHCDTNWGYHGSARLTKVCSAPKEDDMLLIVKGASVDRWDKIKGPYSAEIKSFSRQDRIVGPSHTYFEAGPFKTIDAAQKAAEGWIKPWLQPRSRRAR